MALIMLAMAGVDIMSFGANTPERVAIRAAVKDAAARAALKEAETIVAREGAAIVKEAQAARRAGAPGGIWKVVGEAVDGTISKQLTANACAEACAQTLLKESGTIVYQSNIAAFQASVMTSSADVVAQAMNKFSGGSSWKGFFVDVVTNPSATFNALRKNGPFMTTLRTFGMDVSHFVIVDGLDASGKVIIRDPADGSRYLMQWAEFLRVWEGQCVWRQ
jgi:hypothetical protein